MKKFYLFLSLVMAALTAGAATVTDVITPRDYVTAQQPAYVSLGTYDAPSGNSYGALAAVYNYEDVLRFVIRSSAASGLYTTAVKEGMSRVKKVTIDFYSSTADGRTVEIYGSHTPLSAADMFATTKPEMIGSITKNGDELQASCDITADYEYIGLRSSLSIIYINSYTVEYEADEAALKPVVSYTCGEGGKVSLVKIPGMEQIEGNSTKAEVGDQFACSATADDGYVIDRFAVNGAEVALASGQQSYAHLVNVEGDTKVEVTFRKVEVAPSVYNITINVEGDGAVRIYDANGDVGDTAEEGTELYITVMAMDGNHIHLFEINGEEVANTKGEMGYVAYHTVKSDVVVDVVFKGDDEPVDYCILTGNATRDDNRGISKLEISDNYGSTAEIPGAGTSATHALYVDHTDIVFETKPGRVITIKNNGEGNWMSSYVYIDYNKNGLFEFDDVECNGAHVDGELVAHTGFDVTGADPTVMSDGTEIDWGKSYTGTIPSFTIPANLPSGLYRIRHKVDWNCANPCGRTSANGYNDNFISANGGGIIDFTISVGEIDALETIEATEEVAPVYYDLQGIRVDNPSAGVYIRVAGSTAEKVYIK